MKKRTEEGTTTRSLPALIPCLAALVLVGCGRPAGHPSDTEGSASGVAAADTARPPVPDNPWQATNDTLTYPLVHADHGVVYYRTVLLLVFDSTASGPQVRGALADFHARIIARPRGSDRSDTEYVVEIPDPGPDLASFDRVVDALEGRPGVSLVVPMAHRRPFHVYDR